MGNLVFQATLGGQVNLVGPNTASTYNINVPAVAGTMVTTGDTGTVTNTMLAGSIANAKLSNSSVTIGATTVALGATATTLVGITSLGVNSSSPAVTAVFSGTDAISLPSGTTAQRPTGAAGYLRFNSTTTQFEGYNGSAWSSVGGAAISNDTSTATNVYPLFASATTGTALTVYTSNAKLLYKPSTGEFQSSVLNSTNGIVVNSQTVATSYTIATGSSAMSAGPVSVASGQSVTVSSGSRWVVI
jgi:hypothetical protein